MSNGNEKQCDFYVAGIGASAGGLEALESFCQAIPDDSGMAYVVIQHLSPDFETHMPELLRRHTQLAVVPAEDGMKVESNTIYLLPPRKEMIICDGRLLLADKDREQGLSLPIDHFFRSLARDRGRFAIGIVLSGSGSDGTRGVQAISEAGGLTLAQDPETARFDSMPRSAIATEIVDVVMAPSTMPGALVRYVDEALSGEQLAAEVFPMDGSSDFQNVIRLLRESYQLDFNHYKPHTVMRRIDRRLSMQRHGSLETYVERLKHDEDELNELYRDLLIGVTQFFRDKDAFKRIEERIIPDLIEKIDPEDEIRCWVAGCATGEEVYSLAMLFHETLTRMGRPVNVKIFATDVHRTSLEFASRGVYAEDSLVNVQDSRREAYFKKKRDGYHVRSEIRQMVVFAAHDVLSAAPFTRMDLISCRNMLIYFQPAAQKTALSLFHFGLKTGGYLLLGASETPGELSNEFETIDRRWKIYQKKRDVHLSAPMRSMNRPNTSFVAEAQLTSSPSRRAISDQKLLTIYDEILESALSAGFLVDDQMNLVHTFGDAGRFVQIRSGRLSNNLLDLIAPDLRTSMSGAITQALKEGKAVRFTGLRVRHPDGPLSLSLQTRPIDRPTAAHRHVLVLLEEVASEKQTIDDGTQQYDADEASRDQIQSLETELRYSRENLQATIEELETANEELQAANEELVASNEELQSTNEELHSVNEELYTVNAEHHRKISELNELNDDLDHLLLSSEIAVLFLDEDLNVRKFTPKMAEMFHLIAQDVGRSIESFTHRIHYDGLMVDLKNVVKNGEKIEREVLDDSGAAQLVKMLPHSSPVRTGGVVLTVVDVSTLKRQEAKAREWAAIAESSGDAIIGLDQNGKIVNWNTAAETTYGYSSAEAADQDFEDLLVPEKSQGEWRTLFQDASRGIQIPETDAVRLTKEGLEKDVSLHLSPIFSNEGNLVGVAAIERDATVRRRIERQQKLQHAVAHTLKETTVVENAILKILDALVQVPEFRIAEYWEIDPETDSFTWLSASFGDGVSGGREWNTALAEAPPLRFDSTTNLNHQMIPRVSSLEDRNFTEHLQNYLEMYGVHSLVAIPILVKGQMTGIIKLFASLDVDSMVNWNRVLRIIAQDVGHFAAWAEGEIRLEQLADIIAQSQDFVATFDESLLFNSVNPAGAKLVGSQADEIIGRHLTEFLTTESADELREIAIPKAYEDGFWAGETTFIDLNNHEIPVSQMLLVHRDSAENIQFLSTIARDLTEQKKIEAQYEEARTLAEQASNAKSRFLANMSHEVRTPMTAVVGLADLLIESEPNRERQDLLKSIAGNGRFVTQLLNDILDLAKVEAGKLKIEKSLCSPVQLVSELVDLLQNRAQERDTQLSLQLLNPVPKEITTDPIRLRQILFNLVGNAIKFTDRGHIQIEFDWEVGIEEPSMLSIAVRDTGCGISEEEVESIFDEFSQHDLSSNRRALGTGLGLPISRRLALALGGEIKVQSILGEGSCFTLKLPVNPQEENFELIDDLHTEQTEVQEQIPVSLNGVRAFLAEDTSANQFLINKFVKFAGGETTTFDDGQALLDHMQSIPNEDWPDVILLDMNMPRLDGYQTAQRLEKMKFERPIIALTASAMEGDRTRCLQAGCTAYVTKPIDRNILLTEIAQGLNLSPQHGVVSKK